MIVSASGVVVVLPRGITPRDIESSAGSPPPPSRHTSPFQHYRGAKSTVKMVEGRQGMRVQEYTPSLAIDIFVNEKARR